MTGYTRDYRNGPSGEATNELESLLTVVVTSADTLADGEVADERMLQRELGVLEDALTRALSVVGRLSAMAHARSQARRDHVT